jgi:hydrogenase maturation protease
VRKVLLLGIGNPGRRDDGLGPALAERIERLNLPDVAVDADYQLTVDDAADAAKADVLIVADADATGAEPYSFKPIAATDHLEFSSHSVEPGGVLGLCETAFGHKPEAFILGIRGYEFDTMVEGLTDKAASNIEEAQQFLVRLLEGDRAFTGC